MRSFFAIISFILIFHKAKAQCRQWIGEPYNNIDSIVHMIQRDVPIKIVFNKFESKTSFIHGTDSRLKYVYNDTLRGPNVAHIEIWFGVEATDSLVGVNYIINSRKINSIIIKGPVEWINTLGKSLKKTVLGCIVRETDTYVLFGDTNNPHRLLINAYPGELDLLKN